MGRKPSEYPRTYINRFARLKWLVRSPTSRPMVLDWGTGNVRKMSMFLTEDELVNSPLYGPNIKREDGP